MFGLAQFHFIIADRKFHGGKIKGIIVNDDDGVWHSGRRYFSQLCIDPGSQNSEREGFGDVIIRSQFQSVYNIQIGIIGSEQNNGDGITSFFEFFQEIQSAAIRKVDVQQDQRWHTTQDLFPG